MAGPRALLERVKASRAYAAWTRYGDANGDLLAGGVAYYGFFSVFPAIALGAAVFGFVLQGRPELLTTIGDYLNGVLPGMVRTASHPDGLITLEAPRTSTLTVTSVVSLVTLVLSGAGWVGALRTGIRAIFGLPGSPGNPITDKLRDLGVFFTIGLGVALSAVITSVAGGLATHVAEWVGLPSAGWLVTGLGLLLGFAFDAALMVLLLRVLSGVPLPWRHVRRGAIFGAVLLTVLKYFGGVLISRATRNPVLGAVAVAVGLLFWLNLMSRVTLLSASWAANDVDLARLTALRQHSEAGSPTTASRAPYAAGPASRHTSSRAGDRVSIASGAVVGALLALVVSRFRRLRRGTSRVRGRT